MKRQKQTTQPRKPSKKNLGRYKSGLEKTCAELLAESGLDFTYEEVGFDLVEKFKYEQTYFKMTAGAKRMSDKTGQVVLPIKYTPDFVAKDGGWIIETKGYLPSHHDFPMRWKLFLKMLSERNEPLPKLFICKNREQIEQAISIIKDENETYRKKQPRRKLRPSDIEDTQDDI